MPVKNRLSDLRDHLFETIERLKDEDKPMEIDRAKAISNVAQTIINSAKAEMEAAGLLGIEPTDFLAPKDLPQSSKLRELPPAANRRA